MTAELGAARRQLRVQVCASTKDSVQQFRVCCRSIVTCSDLSNCSGYADGAHAMAVVNAVGHIAAASVWCISRC